MILIAAVELALGYVLIYAAAMNGGRDALSPWGVFTD